MRVAISQPCYAPWCGYLALLDAADVFVLLDSVPISKQSWQLRNRVRQRDGRLVWLSVPTHAELGQPLCEVEIAQGRPWQRKHWSSILQCYGKDRLGFLEEAYREPWRFLGNYTSDVIRMVAGHLGIDTEIVQASDLGPTRDGKTERLEDILSELGATSYLTTAGAAYLHGETHVGAVPLEWFQYTPQPYPQGGQEWCSHLSIVDLIAHCPDPLSVVRAGVSSARVPSL